jgi:tetratricopeptide (TPR) repeat protein
MTRPLKPLRWISAAALLATLPAARSADLRVEVSIRETQADALVTEALAAEAKLDSHRALELFLEADKARPNDPFIVQKIARQYSDLTVDTADNSECKRCAQTALEYARRSEQLDPKNPVNVLSVAVCLGKLAEYSDTRTKIENSRIVKEEAERAIALNPGYAWAHHLLGRWNYEVATLGTTTRFFVRIIYGGLPEASTARGVTELSRAVELEPGELAHQLELGFALLADGQKEKARSQFAKGLGMPSRGKHDEAAKERARLALAKLS